MHNLSMAQALGVWSELEAAYYGKNGFGSDTAEIYAYRLMPRSPRLEATERASPGLNSYGAQKERHEAYIAAAHSLRALILHFEETHVVSVVVRLSETDRVPAAAWLSDNYFDHRLHVTVVHKKAM